MIKVSVVVPVYDPGARIDELIDSLLTQSLGTDEYEIIFVDDDSTDGTRQRLQALAARQHNVRVLHNRPNSGWPGRPRNLGIDAARGLYVFFADHDDWLPHDALRRLWEFADACDSDVVVPKEIGHGHRFDWEAFDRTRPRADVASDPLWSPPTPHKLIRRALLDGQGIRFPEGRVRLEDHLVIARAFFAADVVSVLAGEPSYHWMHHDDTNASLQVFDPDAYYRDLDKVLDVVAANSEAGEPRNRLYQFWYRNNMLRRLGSLRFLSFPVEYQRAMFDAVRRIVLERFDPVMDAALVPLDRARAHLVREGSFDLALLLAELDAGATTEVTVSTPEWSDAGLVLAARSTLVDARGGPVRFRRRGPVVERVVPDELAAALPADALDVTGWIDRGAGTFLLKDGVTQDDVAVPTGWTASWADTDDGELNATGAARAVLDPFAGCAGAPLPERSDLYLRSELVGWRSERRLPYPAAPDGSRPPVTLPYPGGEFSAYATAETANYSIKRLGRPPAPAPG